MKVTIVGCGNMGLVYARAFLRYQIVNADSLILAEKNEQRRDELMRLNLGKVTVADTPEIGDTELLILAVKPQDFNELAPKIAPYLTSRTTVVSIMAGITLQQLASSLGTTQVVRAMPNSPVELGLGMTGFSAGTDVLVAQIRQVEQLIATTGRTVFFEDEKMLDAVTAVSGSGPAYFFYIVRAMIEAGKEMGMSEAVAATLVKQTMLGSFHLINNAGKSLDDLIGTVASRGGTTEAALREFEKYHVHEGLKEGMKKAEQRAGELANLKS
jgi:pyrroline-5-carboxylate reductase